MSMALPARLTTDYAVLALKRFLERYRGQITALTGAGVSTDSGIPDYRGPQGTYVVSGNYRPILFQEFIQAHQTRQRYWARSYLGYIPLRRAKPNATHRALASLESHAYVRQVITQNVDGLHQAAGSQQVLELHGTLATIECLRCQHQLDRMVWQDMLSERNPDWHQVLATYTASGQRLKLNPDGDVDLPQGVSLSYLDFQYPSCLACNTGFYKPSVIFFGENLAMAQKSLANAAVSQSPGALWVMGSSLATYSAFGLVKRAHEAGHPIIIVNHGPTRADSLPGVMKLHSFTRDVVPQVLYELRLTVPPIAS
ncbi:hypothetical protein H4R35_000822 [Dimargaris xerosporica]|nr:hypothetical protein H4R35_000822 [Dimargaris xerosporica]